MTADNKPTDKMGSAYNTMLGRVQEGLSDAAKTSSEALSSAREKAVELGELTREEAAKLSSYLERDIQDAASFISQTGQDFKDWFAFDWHLIERRVFDALASVADRTSIQLGELAERARAASTINAGEVVGPGTLVCDKCGAEMHFMHSHAVPPCPQCHATQFRRWSKS